MLEWHIETSPISTSASVMLVPTLTVKKEANTQKKISNNEASLKSFDLQLKTAQQVAEVLKCYAEIKDAVQRIDVHEIAVLKDKQTKVNISKFLVKLFKL